MPDLWDQHDICNVSDTYVMLHLDVMSGSVIFCALCIANTRLRCGGNAVVRCSLTALQLLWGSLTLAHACPIMSTLDGELQY